MSFQEAPKFPRTRVRRERSRTVHDPYFGLFLDRPVERIPSQGLQECLNVDINRRSIVNENMGWEPFPVGGKGASPAGVPINLDSEQVLLIDELIFRDGNSDLILGNKRDLFYFNPTPSVNDVRYITPVYVTGTVTGVAYSAGPDETTITGTTTLWNTDPTDRSGLNNVIAGDYLHIGSNAQNDPTANWYLVKSVASDTSIVVEGNATADFTGPSDPYTIRQCFRGDELDVWSYETFPAFDTGSGLEDRWYATNGVDYVVRWRGQATDTFATRVNLGFECKIIKRFKNMMLYMGLSESGETKPQSIRNSDVGSPENVTTGLASEFVASEGVDAIIGAAQIGDLLAVYNRYSINVLQFVGDPYIFLARTAVPNRGLLASRGLIDFGDLHQFISEDRAFEFDGTRIRELGSQLMRQVISSISPERTTKLIAHINEERGQVHWVVPMTTDATGTLGGPVRSYTEHYEDTFSLGEERLYPFTMRDLPATAIGHSDRSTRLTWAEVVQTWASTGHRWNSRFFEASFPYTIFGDENGYVYVLGTTNVKYSGSTASSLLPAYFRTARKEVVDGDYVGVVKRLVPFCPRRESASYVLGVALYTADRFGGSRDAPVSQSYALDHSGTHFLPFRKSGRYAEFLFITFLADQPWEVQGWSIKTLAAGNR